MANRQGKLKWVSASNGSYPVNAVEIGRRCFNGEMMYVGRAVDGDIVIPGKIVPSHRCCYVGWGWVEMPKVDYEVLVNDDASILEWIHCSNGEVPTGAIFAGKDSLDDIYIGRTRIPEDNGAFHGGKVHPSHGCIYVPYGGREVQFTDYEVLCRKFKYA